jgi:hypothetical protein
VRARLPHPKPRPLERRPGLSLGLSPYTPRRTTRQVVAEVTVGRRGPGSGEAVLGFQLRRHGLQPRREAASHFLGRAGRGPHLDALRRRRTFPTMRPWGCLAFPRSFFVRSSRCCRHLLASRLTSAEGKATRAPDPSADPGACTQGAAGGCPLLLVRHPGAQRGRLPCAAGGPWASGMVYIAVIRYRVRGSAERGSDEARDSAGSGKIGSSVSVRRAPCER